MKLFKRDAQFIQFVLGFLRPWLRFYYRVRCEGLERVGNGPFLFISNHNAGAAIEVFALLNEWEKRFQGKREVYALAHRADFKMNWSGNLFQKVGAIPANHQNANFVLMGNHDLIIFPGGNYEGFRPIWQRKRCDFGGHQGWAKIAIEELVPVVPIVISGSHETNPIFLRSRVLSQILILPNLLGITWFPISLAQLLCTAFVIYLSWNRLPIFGTLFLAYFVFCATLLCPILPSRIRIRFLEPIPPSDFKSSDELYQKVTNQISRKLAGI
jgi:1-acyl-sn-glycerol-3-phosphate acyltransferase